MNHYTFWEVFALSAAGALGWNAMDAISEGAIDGIALAFKFVFNKGIEPARKESE